MKTVSLSVLLPFLLAVSADAGSIDDARSAATWYISTLKATVARAVRDQGAARAVEVCNREARRLTADLFRESGLSLKLTALRVRNPVNEPTAAERRIIEGLLVAQAEGKLPEEMLERVTEDGRERTVYVKPVLMKEECLLCHGRNVPREITAIIRSRYPEDRATGYEIGDLRGIVRIILPEKSAAVPEHP